MAIAVAGVIFLFGLILSIKSPRKALLSVVFFSAWAGLDVDVGLRLTAYRLLLAGLLCALLVKVSQSPRARQAVKSLGVLWLVPAYAALWTVLAMFITPEADVAGGWLRSPDVRSVGQILMFSLTLSPLAIVPWLIRDPRQIADFFKVYLFSACSLAGIGWIQILVWNLTGVDPIPVGVTDVWLGGAASMRSGQFQFANETVYRMSSFGGEPKGLGVSLAVGLLIIQAGVIRTRQSLAWIWSYLLISMIATFSTMAILVWVGASLVQIIVERHSHRYLFSTDAVLKKRWALLVGVIFIAIPGAYFLFPQSGIVNLLEMRTVGRVFGEDTLGRAAPGYLEDFNIAILGFLREMPVHALTGVGLGNAHLYADPYLPPFALDYADGTVFVAKSYLLRWVSEIGLVTLLLFLSRWWVMLRVGARRLRIADHDSRLADSIKVFLISVLAFWLVSGYITPQFFLFSGLIVAMGLLNSGKARNKDIASVGS